MKIFKADWFSVFWIIFILYYKRSAIIPILFAIVLHELGHLLASLLLGIKINRIYISIFGARLEIANSIPYYKELLMALAGPLLGIVGYLLTIKSAMYHPSLMAFSITSLALSIFNLFPLDTLDGGRVIRCVFCSLFSLDTAEKTMQILSFFTLFSFWLISVYIMIKFAAGLSGFVFCSIFFSKCFILNSQN